jgi:hypothetical protein
MPRSKNLVQLPDEQQKKSPVNPAIKSPHFHQLPTIIKEPQQTNGDRALIKKKNPLFTRELTLKADENVANDRTTDKRVNACEAISGETCTLMVKYFLECFFS